jgi:hypothetical protein
MSETTKNPRRLRRAVLALSGLALLVAATAGAGIGSAAASSHHASHHPQFHHQHRHHFTPPHGGYHPTPPSGGHDDPGTEDPVPGVNYTTDPGDLQPPPITVLKTSPHLADGSIFVAPKAAPGATAPAGQQGPEIVDNEGRPIWFQPVDAPYSATDFRVQQYRGQSVLTYDVGQSTGGPGHSEGTDVILDRHYHQIATVEAGNGLKADQHEFVLTPQGTALITIYNQVPYDLSSVGGPANGSVLDGVVEEVDVATGKVLFEWHSLDHVPLTDSHQPVPTDASTPYDYFHVNAVNLDNDGNLLISARHTWTVYKVDRHSGDVIWRLGGKESDFQLGPGVEFSWQHNALPEGPNTIRIFDNASSGTPVLPHSRIIRVHLDLKAKTASLVSSIEHPDGLSAGSQGNSQLLPGGHLFVGWGQLGRFSEFDSAGNLLWDGSVPAGYDTYRAYRSPWVGEPDSDPTAEAASSGWGDVSVKAIWNGATEVDRWLVLAGSRPWSLHPVESAPWDGLSTAIDTHTHSPYVEVVALEDRGRTIGRSQPVPVSD